MVEAEGWMRKKQGGAGPADLLKARTKLAMAGVALRERLGGVLRKTKHKAIHCPVHMCQDKSASARQREKTADEAKVPE